MRWLLRGLGWNCLAGFRIRIVCELILAPAAVAMPTTASTLHAGPPCNVSSISFRDLSACSLTSAKWASGSMRLYFDLIAYWLDASVSSDFESSGRFSELHTHIEFHLTMTALIVRLRTSSLPMRTRDFHPFEHAHGAHNKETAPPKRCCSEFCKINALRRASLIFTH